MILKGGPRRYNNNNNNNNNNNLHLYSAITDYEYIRLRFTIL